jgi:divalent metal cation (Fe/Co/Zn/Cd) transporter
VGIVWLTGVVWLDPAVALLAGANILGSAVGLMRKSFSGLLDAADPAMTQRILTCLEEATHTGKLAGFHQLRHRQSNDTMWVQVHMLLPGDLTTREAHGEVTRVEEAVQNLFPNFAVHVTSHIEPDVHEGAHPEGHPELDDPYTAED